jgi:hypothetical protein
MLSFKCLSQKKKSFENISPFLNSAIGANLESLDTGLREVESPKGIIALLQ